MGYKEIALPMAERGVPTIPLKPRSKIAFISEWEEKATTAPSQIIQWDGQYPDANGACVAYAKPEGIWFFEVDKPEVVQRIEAETGQKIPRTFRVRSSPGRGHFYFKQTPASISMGNIGQQYVRGADWSGRVDRQYVVAPGSIHPQSGNPYEIVSPAPIIEAPDWLINWCASQKAEKKSTPASDQGPIVSGGRNNTLTSIGGKMRNTGLEHPEIEAALLRINLERCVPPLPDDEVRTIAASVSRYKIPPPDIVLIGGKPVGSSPRPTGTERPNVPVETAQRPRIDALPYPEFPHWIMKGTSLYEGLVKPVCDRNSRYPEFMFMPAMTLLMNYIGTRVFINLKGHMSPSIFLALIGERGRLIKSSSVEDAIRYFDFCGLAKNWNPNLKNAEGRSIVYTAGSPEGLGIEMARLNCKNGILYYDELSTLTNKASIESSSLSSNLLSLYESGPFTNLIKSKKDTYSVEQGSYCASLIVCSTDKNFLVNWSKLAGKSSGLDDRFFFLYQPKVLKKREPFIYVATQPGTVETMLRIRKALDIKTYSISDDTPLRDVSDRIGNRPEIRAEKFALGFAVDLGRDEIDEDCVDRAVKLIEYEHQVKRYLKLYESFTKEGAIQMEIKYALFKSPKGEMLYSDLTKKLHADRYGTTLWNQAYNGLVKTGAIAESKDSPLRAVLLDVPEEEED